jgi:hypothetical protein
VLPSHISTASQLDAGALQTLPRALKRQVSLRQHAANSPKALVLSHCSPSSRIPLPHTLTNEPFVAHVAEEPTVSQTPALLLVNTRSTNEPPAVNPPAIALRAVVLARVTKDASVAPACLTSTRYIAPPTGGSHERNIAVSLLATQRRFRTGRSPL